MGKPGIIVGVGMFIGGAAFMFLVPEWEWVGSILTMATGLWVVWFSRSKQEVYGYPVPAWMVVKYRRLFAITLIVIAVLSAVIWVLTGMHWLNTHLVVSAVGVGLGATVLVLSYMRHGWHNG